MSLNRYSLILPLLAGFFLSLLVQFDTMAQYNYFDLPAGKSKSNLSFENFDNIVIIEAILDDSVPLRLILDSGVEGIILTDYTTVNRFAPRCIRTFEITAPGSVESLEACITSPVKLAVKGLSPMLTNLILLSHDYFALESYIGTRVDGLIGMERFKNLVVTANYDRNNITFRKPDRYKLPSRSTVIPVSIIRGKPYMNARIELDNGSILEAWLMIDSGANHPLLLETDSLGDYKPAKSIEAVIGKGLGGIMEGRFVRTNWILLGNYRLYSVITSFTDEYLPGNSAGSLNRNGTLGSGALARFKVTFDYLHERMILEKGARFDDPFEYNMSGINFKTGGAGFNIFEVSDIIPSSPASDAGILPGDLLIAIDNHFTFNMTLGEVNRRLSSGDGARLNLMISRQGKQMFLKIRLRKLI